MKPSHYGPIPDLLVKLFGQMAVKLFSGPMGLMSQFWMPNQFLILGALFWAGFTEAPCVTAFNQAINASFVEALNPTGQCPSRDAVKSCHLAVHDAQQ